MQCPMCKKEVEQSFEVASNNKEPFTAVHALQGLFAWGGYGVPRTVLCENQEFVHFSFDFNGEEHLVKMVKYDPKAIAIKHQYWNENPEPCEHDGCTEMGIPRYLHSIDTEPMGWYCDEHTKEGGFCWMCSTFAAGTEAFDFSSTGLCGSCQEELEDEMSEDFDIDRDWF